MTEDQTYPDKPADAAELEELDVPAEEATEEVTLEDSEDVPEVDQAPEEEVTESNFEAFLPGDGGDESVINQVLANAPQGVLNADAQAAYLETPPDPQESWTDGEPT